MPKSYQIVPPPSSPPTLDPQQLAELLAKDGQLILSLLDLLESAQCALDDLIDVMGRATNEAVLRMSAEMIAGPKQQGKKSDHDVVYHGTQQGRVALKDRQLNVEKPRLRRRNPKEGEPAEVEIPAYEAMRKDDRLADRMLEIVIAGVSTRRYQKVLPEMAQTVGVSKSQVSRETIEAGQRVLEDLATRDFSALDLLAVWIDGVQLGTYHVVCAAGVDA
jgi:transposase-like protein